MVSILSSIFCTDYAVSIAFFNAFYTDVTIATFYAVVTVPISGFTDVDPAGDDYFTSVTSIENFTSVTGVADFEYVGDVSTFTDVYALWDGLFYF